MNEQTVWDASGHVCGLRGRTKGLRTMCVDLAVELVGSAMVKVVCGVNEMSVVELSCRV